jgi:hypothetical protein
MIILGALSLLERVIDRIPCDIGLTIDGRCGYPNTVSSAVGINQSKLDLLSYACGILYVHGGKRRYKEEKFDSIIHCFTAKEKKLHVIQHQFNIGPKRRQTILIGFGNLAKHREILHPHRLGETLIKEIKSFCKIHPLPSIDESIITISRGIPQSTTESVTAPESTVESNGAEEPEGMHGSTAEPEVVRESTDDPSSHIIPVQDAEQPEPGITFPDIVEAALTLDMNITNRRKRNSDAIIPLHNRNQLSPQDRALVALTTTQMLWDRANKRQSITIAEAACKYKLLLLGQ